MSGLWRGFTLIEVMLAAGAISLLAGIALPVFRLSVQGADLSLTALTVGQVIRRAQALSMAGESDAQWGVHMTSGSAMLFQGSSYATRNAAFDETTTFSASVTATGLGDVVFNKVFGEPDATGTITLQAEGENRGISINNKGSIDL